VQKRARSLIVDALRLGVDDQVLTAGADYHSARTTHFPVRVGRTSTSSDPHDGDRIEAAYPGPTLARLRRIKGAYDPTNLFHNNDNITPDQPPKSH
jgi:FAD/FMN-containing dehydrogenase